MSDLSSLVSLRRAATILGISRPTLYKWVTEGKVYPIRIGQTSFLFYQTLIPLVIKKCSTCYHNSDDLCRCREKVDMITKPGKCPDWHLKDERETL